jgi:hypothetical protein
MSTGNATEAVERVARALWDAAGDLRDPERWDETSERFRDDYRRRARAAIAALREPTEAMILAGVHHDNMGDMAGRWRAMIDAALWRTKT